MLLCFMQSLFSRIFMLTNSLVFYANKLSSVFMRLSSLHLHFIHPPFLDMVSNDDSFKDNSPDSLANDSPKDNNLESSIESLKKFYKKDKLRDQLSLTYIYFNKIEKALKYTTNPKLQITLNLYQNIIKIEIKDCTVKKYLLIQEKVFKRMFKDFEVVKYILVGIRLNREIGELGDFMENGDEGNLSNTSSNTPLSSSNTTLSNPSPSTSPTNSLFKVYNYKCSSLDYQNILSSILEYLLNHFDLNLIFIYYQIATLSCYLNNCKLNCREVAHETIKRELLDLSYLKILGYKNLVILYEMYKEIKILEIINEINPYVEEKYKIKKEKLEKKEVKITKNEEMPIEETVLIKEMDKPNGIVAKSKGI